jgi:hypothetical protein
MEINSYPGNPAAELPLAADQVADGGRGALASRSDFANFLLQVLAFAHEHVNLPHRGGHLPGAKSLLCHRPPPFFKLNTQFNLAQKKPVTSYRPKLLTLEQPPAMQ